MPIYDYCCLTCGPKEDVWAKIDEMILECPNCQGEMRRTISPTRLQLDIQPYFDENLADSKTAPNGQWVKSRQHKAKLLKEQGLVEIG